MYSKRLLFITLFSAYSFSIYGTSKKTKKSQRLDIDPKKLTLDIKEMFLTQAVFGSNLNFDANDWKRVSQNNPFFLQELQDINYECLAYAKNEKKFKNFCEKYKIPLGSYEDMR